MLKCWTKHQRVFPDKAKSTDINVSFSNVQSYGWKITKVVEMTTNANPKPES